ncbi:hypothetical protein [Metarhizobium album]|uniref:hypothetical protein n=1 Tax=Metarhizobium album TaxID=2182425 RepID=UPI000FFE35EA|nr:hypothetical protein [Rhizobium album]
MTTQSLPLRRTETPPLPDDDAEAEPFPFVWVVTVLPFCVVVTVPLPADVLEEMEPVEVPPDTAPPPAVTLLVVRLSGVCADALSEFMSLRLMTWQPSVDWPAASELPMASAAATRIKDRAIFGSVWVEEVISSSLERYPAFKEPDNVRFDQHLFFLACPGGQSFFFMSS